MPESPVRRRFLPLCLAPLLLLAWACGPAAREDAGEPAEEPAATAPAAEPGGDAPAARPELSNRIAWSTASEVDNFGYDVFRGDSLEGPFERLNEETIQGAGTVDEPQDYEYFDTTIEPGKVYYYYVESISMGNARERFTPIFPSRPKGVPLKAVDTGADPEGDPDAGEGAGESDG